MKTNLSQILQYYLGTNLAIWHENIRPELMFKLNACGGSGFIGINEVVKYPKLYKPLLRSLSKLTGPITIYGYNEGKPFVPVNELQAQNIKIGVINITASNVDLLPLWAIKLLLSWHFNVFNLQSDQFVEIEEVPCQ